jgi:hypothetical protein
VSKTAYGTRPFKAEPMSVRRRFPFSTSFKTRASISDAFVCNALRPASVTDIVAKS